MPNDKKIKVPDQLPEHHSGVRRMIAEAHASEYVAYKSLAEAKAAANGVVVFEGDDGGQIYLVARASRVLCSQEALHRLLADLDAQAWADPDAARVYYENLPIGAGVAGGMGGGVVTNDIWVHQRLRNFETAIRAVLAGQRENLDGRPVA